MALSPSAAANRRFGFQFQAGDNATSDSHQSWDGTILHFGAAQSLP
jgi:hypothetical protein